MGIGIAEKSHKTKRDCWGGNVNHKSLCWLHYITEDWKIQSYVLCTCEMPERHTGVNIATRFLS